MILVCETVARPSADYSAPPVQIHVKPPTRETVMKSSLLSVLMFSAVLWPAATFAQTAPDAMAKAVKADNMKWEPLGDSAFEISILYTNPTTQATYLVI